MAASRALRRRIQTDAQSPDFWYVPKGQAVHPSNWPRIAEHLKVLADFQTVPWAEAQKDYARELRLRELIEPYKDHKDGFSAVARMQFPIWRLLGLAWINDDNAPEITEVGRRFVDSKSEADRRELLTMQLYRYQFCNPSVAPHFQGFRTFPLLALYRLLLNVEWTLSLQELRLFGSRIRSFDDADDLGGFVEEWRSLSAEEQDELARFAEAFVAESHTKSAEGTTLGKVDRELAYLRALLQIPGTLQETDDGFVVPTAMRKSVKRLVLASAKDAEFIDYESETHWLAYYGQLPDRAHWRNPWSTVSTARAYYERVGRIDAATEAYAREDNARSKTAVKEYRSIQILEKVLEDLLEHNLGELESGLELVGRQFPTAVGPIDLLAKDQDGVYVVIELKRGRGGDRVVGQIARYISWVIDRLGGGKKTQVRGIIVGKSFDHRFGAAVSQLQRVAPYSFDVKVLFERWTDGGDELSSPPPKKKPARAKYRTRRS